MPSARGLGNRFRYVAAMYTRKLNFCSIVPLYTFALALTLYTCILATPCLPEFGSALSKRRTVCAKVRLTAAAAAWLSVRFRAREARCVVQSLS